MRKSYYKTFSFTFCILFLLWTGCSAAKYVLDKSKLEPMTYHISDFQLNSIVEKEPGIYVATDNDPNICIVVDSIIKKVEFNADYYVSPGEIVAFYTNGEMESFSFKHYAIAHSKKDRSDSFSLDIGSNYVHELRIDPTIVAGNKFTIDNIVINNITLTDYMHISEFVLFKMTIICVMISSVIEIISDLKKQ